MTALVLAAYKAINKGTQMKPIVLLRNTGCSHKILNIFKQSFVYTSTIHIFVYGSSTRTSVITTHTDS